MIAIVAIVLPAPHWLDRKLARRHTDYPSIAIVSPARALRDPARAPGKKKTAGFGPPFSR
jgi:hypothetical protein